MSDQATDDLDHHEAPKPGGSGRRTLRRLKNTIKRRGGILAAQLAIIAALLGVWELVSGDPSKGQGLVDSFFWGRPSQIWDQLVQGVSSHVLIDASLVTLRESLIGFVIGALIGLVAGFAFAAVSWGKEVVAPLIYALYAVPRFTLAPLFIVWFGLGIQSKVALIIYVTFFYTFMSTYQGALQVDAGVVIALQMLGASRLQILWRAVIPSAMTWVALAFRQAVPNAFATAIVAELLAGNSGLGTQMAISANQFDTDALFAAIFTSTVLALALYAVVRFIVNRAMRWRDVGGQSIVGL